GAAVAGNIKTVGLEKVVRQFSSFSTSLDVFEDPGNPLSRACDKAKTQPGKYFRQLAGNHCVAGPGRVCRHTPEAGAITDALAGRVDNMGIGITDMHAHR